VSIDSTGEFVAAGGQDVFEAYLWSMKIGKLLEVSTTSTKMNTDKYNIFNGSFLGLDWT